MQLSEQEQIRRENLQKTSKIKDFLEKELLLSPRDEEGDAERLCFSGFFQKDFPASNWSRRLIGLFPALC
jgi:hypothetical protein